MSSSRGLRLPVASRALSLMQLAEASQSQVDRLVLLPWAFRERSGLKGPVSHPFPAVGYGFELISAHLQAACLADDFEPWCCQPLPPTVSSAQLLTTCYGRLSQATSEKGEQQVLATRSRDEAEMRTNFARTDFLESRFLEPIFLLSRRASVVLVRSSSPSFRRPSAVVRRPSSSPKEKIFKVNRLRNQACCFLFALLELNPRSNDSF